MKETLHSHSFLTFASLDPHDFVTNIFFRGVSITGNNGQHWREARDDRPHNHKAVGSTAAAAVIASSVDTDLCQERFSAAVVDTIVVRIDPNVTIRRHS